MGEIAETTTTTTMHQQTKKKKKKGRPSLLDLQKRSLKEQQQRESNSNSFNLSASPSRRATRRNPNPDKTEGISGEGGADDERKEKKDKLLVGLNPHPRQPAFSPNSLSFGSIQNGTDTNAHIEDPEAAPKRRKMSIFPCESGAIMGEKVWKATDTIHALQVESGPMTPLPDKKLLVFILDRLQKKDTHGVFSDPVDPEELPDYHDIIKNPMDFGTVRKKLDGGAYANLEQFENDVLLICTNAMQYNAPDTIFFRQARSMLESAKKDFENARQDSDDSEPQPKVVRRGRPPGKNLMKSLGRSPNEHICPEPSSDPTLASGECNAGRSSAYNLRKGNSSNKLPPGDTCTSWWSEWENEFPASVLKSILKYGKKQFTVDENRRDTYEHPLNSDHGQSILANLEGELKQLISVGLHLEHSYAKSITQFAADLGPAVWKIASKKVEGVLPAGFKFGPGWIGENETFRHPLSLFSEEKSSESSIPDDNKSKLLHKTTTDSNTVGLLWRGQDDCESADLGRLISLKSSIGEMEPVPPFGIRQKPMVSSDINALDGGHDPGFSSQIRMVRLATLTGMPSSVDASVPSQMVGINSGGNSTIYQISRDYNELNEAGLSETVRTHSGPGLWS